MSKQHRVTVKNKRAKRRIKRQKAAIQANKK